MAVLDFYSKNPSIKQSIDIVKFGLSDDGIPLESKIFAINNVADMATHNSITKDDLIYTLRWIFEHYEF